MEKIVKKAYGVLRWVWRAIFPAFMPGMPPTWRSLGIGIFEMEAMQLIGEDNVREATLFPRDLSRLGGP